MKGTDLGLPFSESIHATAFVSGSTILWTFNETFNPPIDVGSSRSVEHVVGQLVVQASLLPGVSGPLCSHTACERNVRLSVVPGPQHAGVRG